MVRAKCFCIFKNEEDVIEDWLRYHLDIFGDGNIHLIDDHSTDGSSSIVERYVGRVTVEKSIVSACVYKNENISRVMSYYKRECDLLIPLDADEFICLQNGADPEEIRAALNRLDPSQFGRFKFPLNYSAIPRHKEASDPLLEYNDFRVTSMEFFPGEHVELSKSFFSAEAFLSSDGGNHNGFTLNPATQYTDLWLMTFPVRSRKQLEEKLCKGAIYNGFWKRFPQNSSHWRMGYERLREGRFEEYYGYWSGEHPQARRLFFAKRLKELRNPVEFDSARCSVPVDQFTELSRLSSSISDLLCNWVYTAPASHACFDLPDTQQQNWRTLADDPDSIVRFGMLRRYNPTTFIQSGAADLLPGIDEAVDPHLLRTQVLLLPNCATPSATSILKAGDVLSVRSFAELKTLLPTLAPEVVVEVRLPETLSPPLPALLTRADSNDSRSWELLFAAIDRPAPNPTNAVWLKVPDRSATP